MEMNQTVPSYDHLIEVDKLGRGFSVTHTCKGKLVYTGTFEKEMDALRSAALIGSAAENNGHVVCLNINTYLRR